MAVMGPLLTILAQRKLLGVYTICYFASYGDISSEIEGTVTVMRRLPANSILITLGVCEGVGKYQQ